MRNILLILALFFSFSCLDKNEHAYLQVSNASSQGQYEIYRLSGENRLHLVSEEIGKFNEKLKLEPGSYLVFSDCSSQEITLRPKEVLELRTTTVNFSAPFEPSKDDKFSVQCRRHDKTQSQQTLVNKFSLNLLEGKRDLLVGLQPRTLDTNNLELNSSKLAAIKVANETKSLKRFFVSPLDAKIAATESQQLGHWLLVMPGKYTVELNGTREIIEVGEGETKMITPAFIKVTTSQKIDLSLAESISGNPLYIEINGKNWLNLNEFYPILPGETSLRLFGSERQNKFTVAAGETIEKYAKSVQVDLDCPPFDWVCLGSKKIFLYEKDEHYPFAHGQSDVPLLYFSDDVWLSIEGSTGIRYHLPAKTNDHRLKSGRIKLTPYFELWIGASTDLVRIESIAEPLSGYTLDIPLDKGSTIPLIVGTYYLAQYVSINNAEADRRKSKRRIFISPRETISLKFPVYLSEKRYKAYEKRVLAEKNKPKRGSSIRNFEVF